MDPGEHAHTVHRHPSGTDKPPGVIDPVCHMEVNPGAAAASVEHNGRTFYFCSKHCAQKFQAEPGRFTTDSGAGPASKSMMLPVIQPTASSSGGPAQPLPAERGPVKYTCPMHPEIVRDGPGSCPICGMALEAMTVSADEDEDHELRDMTRRFWICLALSVPLVVLSMAEMVPGLVPSGISSSTGLLWVQLLLAAPVVLWGGFPFFERGWKSVLSRNLNMFTLIALGTGSAFVFSTIAVLAPGIFPDSFRGHGGELAVYFEPAAVIVTLVLLGQVLELRAPSPDRQCDPRIIGAGTQDSATDRRKRTGRRRCA